MLLAWDNEDYNLNRRIGWALLLSILLHLALIFSFKLQSADSKEIPIEVTFLQPKSGKKLQIVTPSQSSDTTPPKETNLLSDKDSSAPKEQLKRGFDGGSPVKPNPNPPKTQSEQVKEQQPLKLKLSQKHLEKNFLDLEAEKEISKTTPQKKVNEKERTREFYRTAPFQRKFSNTEPGSPDYLPTIQDGEVTLLNTKADKHAVFVRRVALQVFGSLRRRNWQELSLYDAQTLSSHAIVEAVMSPKGELLSVSVQNSSGNNVFDRIVSAAANEGTRDQNPPTSALATDGNIHFVFHAKVWSRRIGDARREQRWLMLGTGLL